MRFQLSRFLALMGNYQMALDATETSLHSEGSAMRENEKHMQSLQARINKMKVAWEELSLVLGDAVITDSLIALTSFATSVGKAFAWTVEKAGALPVIFGVVTTSVFALNMAFKQFIVSTATTVAGLFGIVPAAGAASGAITGLKFAIRGLLASTGIGLIAVAIGFGLEKLMGVLGKTQEDMTGLSDSYSDMNNKLIETNRLNELADEYSKLANKTDLLTEEKVKLHKVEDELTTKYGIAIKSLEDQANAYQLNSDAINQKLGLLQQEIELEREKASLQYRSEQSSIDSEIEKSKEAKEAAEQLYQTRKKLNQEFNENRKNGIAMSNQNGYFSDQLPSMIGLDPNNKDFTNSIKIMGQQLAIELSKAQKEWEDASANFNKAVNKKEAALKAEFQNYADSIEASGVQITAKTRVLIDALASVAAIQDIEFSSENLDSAFKVFQDSKIENIDDAVSAFKKLPVPINLSGEAIQSLQADLNKLDFGKLSYGADDAAESTSSLETQYEKASKTLEVLNGMLEDHANNKKVSASEAMKLVEADASLIEMFKVENGQIVLNIEAIEAKKNKEIESYQEIFKARKNDLLLANQALVQKLSGYGIEVEALATLEEAYKKIDDVYNERLQNAVTYTQAIGIDAERNKLKNFLGEIDNLKKKAELSKAALNTIGTSTSPEKEKKDTQTQASLHTLTDFSKEEISNINNVIQTRDLNIKSLEKQIETAKKIDDQNRVIELTNQLLLEQKGKIDDITTANGNLKASADSVRSTYQGLGEKFSKDNVGFDDWFNDDASASTAYIETIHELEKAMQNIEGDGKNLTDSQKNQITELENQRELYQKIFSQIQGIKQSWSGNIEEIQKVNDTIQGLNGEISNVFKSEFDKIMDETSKAIDQTIDNLKKKLSLDPADTTILNTNDLNISIDAILAKLNEADSLYPNGLTVVDTSSDARAKLENYKTTLIGLSNVISELNNASYSNAEQLKSNIEKQISFSQEIKSQVSSMKQYISSMTTMYQQQEAAMANQIKNNQKYFDSIIEGLQKQLNVTEVFNLDEFQDSIASIISDLNSIDGTYGTGTFIDSTLGTREDLDAFKQKITEIAKAVADYQNNLSSPSQGSIQNEINFVNNLKSQIDILNNTLRDTELQYKNEEAALQNLITTQTKYYDDQIKAQQEALKNLDEQIEKEDRLKKLQDINDEINKTKGDKRFEYINSAGQVELTYDKGKVSELEKQRDELLKQYQRDDLKKAIQDNIDNLEKAKNETVSKLQEQLDKTKQIHQVELDAQRLYIQNMQNLYQLAVNDVNSKIDKLKSQYDTEIANEQERLTKLQEVHQQELASMNLYVGYLSSLDAALVANTQSKIEQLKVEYENEQKALIDHFINLNDTTKKGSEKFNELVEKWKSGAISKLDSMVSTANERLRQMQAIMSAMAAMSGSGSSTSSSTSSTPTTYKYHTGTDAVGEPPLASNEMPAILKLGETVLTKMQTLKLEDLIVKPLDYLSGLMSSVKLPSFTPTTSTATNSVVYNLSGITIKANNPTEFLEGLRNTVKSHKN